MTKSSGSFRFFLKKHLSGDAYIIFDNTIVKESYSKVNQQNCYHYDHSKSGDVRGTDLLNCLYHNRSEASTVRYPINYRLVSKLAHYCEIDTKRKGERS